MKTLRTMRHLLIAAAVGLSGQAFAQTSILGHGGGPGFYLGWNAAANQTLDVRNDANQPIQWYTDALQRMMLNNTVTTGSINGYTTINQTGYFGLSDEPAFFTTGSGPFSKIHLVEAFGSTNPVNYAQVLGFRDWMRNGITMTGNSDQCYIGAKYNGDDNSDLVLQWSDNPDDAIYGTDRLRFLFTNRRSTTGATTGARSEEGLESFRIFVPNDAEANVGIGDFYRESVLTSSTVDPTERLDVLDGRVRVRELPNDPVAPALTRFLVVDDTPGPEFGVVKWRNIPTGTGGTADCDWTIYNSTTSGPAVPHHIYTAYGASDDCPDNDDNVGIGTSSPVGKLDVVRQPTSGNEVAMFIKTNTDGNYSGIYGTAFGVHAITTNGMGLGSAPIHIGVQGAASNGTYANYGLYGSATNSSTTPNTYGNFGVRGEALGPATKGYGVYGSVSGGSDKMYGTYGTVSGGTGTTNYGVVGYAGAVNGPYSNYGVYGQVGGGDNLTKKYAIYGYHAGNGPDHWSGYFEGRTFSPGGVWTSSDENLKTNIEDLDGAMDRLLMLNPKTYLFTTDHPTMGLPTEQQYGFLAQELETVFPEMVLQTTHPASYDSLGVEIAPEIPFKAVNLAGITPMLVAALQEEHGVIHAMSTAQDAQTAEVENLRTELEEQRIRLDALEALLSSCCAAHGALQNGGGEEYHDERSLGNSDRLLRIAPNPFETQTTVYYQLEKTGRMQLLANSADGKQLQVLQEANLEAGNYQYEWATGDLAPGVYYVTLLLDGMPVTKRAVKILR